MSLKGKKIVLIGGAGFIGHNLALSLKSKGAEISIIDSLQVNNILSFSNPSSLLPNQRMYQNFLNERLDLIRDAGIPFFVQDARDYHRLSPLISELDAEIIIHLAAVAHADRANKDPYSTFDHSLRTLENALDCARDRVKHFIYFSSSMVYGNFSEESVTEESVCDPLGIYGALKYSGEKIITAYNQVFGMPYTIVRPSALYGERCVSRRVIQRFIEGALAGEKLSVHGDGSDSLDFTYIQDLVAGVERVLLEEKSKNQIFNMTFGQSRSLKEVVDILKTRFPNLEVDYLPKDKLMPKRGTLSVEKAKALIGYNPEFPLEKSLPKYIDWYQKNVSLASQTAS